MESAQYSYKRRFPDLWAEDPAEIELGHLVHCIVLKLDIWQQQFY